MKEIIEFENPRYWETNVNCPWCESTNDLYNDVLDSIDNIHNQKILNVLDDNYLVNGYNVLRTFEHWNLKDQ